MEIERTENVRFELGTEIIFIEADQATYTKVLDAMFKMRNDGKDMFERSITRTKGFHNKICMLRTIYCIFSKTGLFKFLLKLD